jgi:hypothetical protein
MKIRGSHIIVFVVLAALLFAVPLSGCSQVDKIVATVLDEYPTAADTLTDMKQVNTAVQEALQRGETAITINTTASEDDINRITENFSPFWGAPTQYKCLAQYDDVLLADGYTAQVNHFSLDLALSTNYYVYNAYTDSAFQIPETLSDAKAVASALPAVISEIFPSGADAEGVTDYEKVLAVHDWLVRNLTYDASIDEAGKGNGIYGAIVDRKTMCRGYAEALQLILTCTSDIDVDMAVGSARNDAGDPEGHAWNIVYIDENWYHIDTTFDDPRGNPDGDVHRYYFGLNDRYIKTDHVWGQDYWPAATGADFLYYRKSGLFAENYDGFVSIVKTFLNTGDPTAIELAVRMESITDEQLQFVFETDRNIATIYRNVVQIGDVLLIRLQMEYR